MEVWQIVLLIIGVLLFLIIGGLIFSIIYTNPIAERLFKSQWVRGKNAFQRGCSDVTFDYHLDMYNIGYKYREDNLKFISDVEIESLNTKLVGEYYDFGFKKAIILLPGRLETCYYGAFYVEPFRQGGYNVLCIDPRAHGLSGGERLTLGFDEAIDAINWARFLHDKKGIERICLYGLCGGATASCLALLNIECPDYVNTFIADGMFYSFYRVYRRHIKDEKKPVFPVIFLLMHKIKKYNRVNPYKAAPNKMMKKLKCSILFLSGTKDKFAYCKDARKMFDKCSSFDKQLVYIENGRHSHLRYDNKTAYDKAVVEFLKAH